MILRRVLALGLLFAVASTLRAADEHAAFKFQHVDYFHRWSQDEQHEFTPAKQEDLEHWSDMMTINGYPSVAEGEKLAETANAVLENYKKNGGKILNTRSVPRTKEEPAEHFIAVLFSRPEFFEAAFARFKMVDGKGYSFVYSHRFYGKRAADEMNAWLAKSGKETENALMEWDPPAKVTSPL